MLVKIGDGFFESAEIAAVMPAAAGSKTELTLRSGRSCQVPVEYEDALADLAGAGLLNDPYTLVLPKLEPGEREELKHLALLGFGWIARDGDGKLFAYRDFPTREGVYWTSGLAGSDTVRLDGDFDFVAADATKPWAIEDLL